jgi:hypothetical protein
MRCLTVEEVWFGKAKDPKKLLKVFLFMVECLDVFVCQGQFPFFSNDLLQDKVIAFDFTIEHVLPQKDGRYNFFLFVSLTTSHEALVHSLGNLIPLEQNLNSHLTAKSTYSNKRSTYERSRYFLPRALAEMFPDTEFGSHNKPDVKQFWSEAEIEQFFDCYHDFIERCFNDDDLTANPNPRDFFGMLSSFMC